ncbi:RNA polymerase subunit sigma-70 [Phytoactinopolyspora limicola]|uniref:RNA polymerase subunit sigma-70 n=1 Tax=Phytoactinopolyspora limicola TaxID=2715536 RepID=UPI00140C926D|nr:RNA polymerase subunit sigma-70 [Phytoactinopolyspora limicola]
MADDVRNNTEPVGGEVALVAAAQAGDEAAFTTLVERYRRELHVHCYRMLASYDDAEDVVQETFLRAWKRRRSYAGRSTFRAWLYRIATNACLDILTARSRRPRRFQGPPLAGAPVAEPPVHVPWLQPYPDRLLDVRAPSNVEPDVVAVERETVELAFLVAIQQLPPRQRAALIIRDVLGWSAAETAALLDTSVASVKSALQRARATMREHLPKSRDDWSTSSALTPEEDALVARYVQAHERADLDLLASLLADDVVQTMPPYPAWIVGRDALVSFSRDVFTPGTPGHLGGWRSVVTSANCQPAVAHYVERPVAAETRDLPGAHRAQVIDVLRIEGGAVAAITSFEPHRFRLFGLPLVLEDPAGPAPSAE